jgi:hypothetical protein
VCRGISAFAEQANGGLIVLADPLTIRNRDLIIVLTARYRLSAIYMLRYFANSGGLIAYGSDQLQKHNESDRERTDLDKYHLEHVCTAHPRMSLQEWQAVYGNAWSLYYTPAHMKTLLRRAAATGVPLGSLMRLLARFALTVPLENVHPLQGGILRLKHPSERRPGLHRDPQNAGRK